MRLGLTWWMAFVLPNWECEMLLKMPIADQTMFHCLGFVWELMEAREMTE